MAQRTLVFDNPAWQAPRRLNRWFVALLGGSLLWLLLYSWLGRRLWAGSPLLGDTLNLWLAIVSICLGVALALGWLRVLPALQLRWHARAGASSWPPLEQEALQSLTPSEFEEYVAYRVFARQGYAVQNTADVKDGGVDIRLTDAAGNEAIVQCKRYANTVGVATVRDLYGTMIHDGARYAYLVTSGPISDAAQEWAEGKPIGLIDGAMVAALSRAEPKSTYLAIRSQAGAL